MKSISRRKLGYLGLLIVLLLGVITLTTLYLPLAHEDIIESYADMYQIDPYFILAIIRTESGFDEKAISPKNAKGLMQLTDQTATWAAQELGIEEGFDVFDPQTNIALGSWYLSYLNKKYQGENDKILAGYNAGVGNVAKWLEDERYSSDGENLDLIPFKETEQFIKRVNRYKWLYTLVAPLAFD